MLLFLGAGNGNFAWIYVVNDWRALASLNAQDVMTLDVKFLLERLVFSNVAS